jgi:hypothetical protein
MLPEIPQVMARYHREVLIALIVLIASLKLVAAGILALPFQKLLQTLGLAHSPDVDMRQPKRWWLLT